MEHFDRLQARQLNVMLTFNENEEQRLISSNFFSKKNLWMLSDKYQEKFTDLLEDYKYYMQDVEKQKIEKNLKILMSKKIVGVTVSGCARFAHYLEKLQAPITIIEEAAEVLETHTISVLTKHTQHLIMIGDHQQLKPQVECYELEKKFNFNISMFERLINNGINYVTLT